MILLPRDGVGDQQQFGAGDGGIHGGLCFSWVSSSSVRLVGGCVGGKGDQRVGQHEFGAADVAQRQRGLLPSSSRSVPRSVIGAEHDAGKPLAAVDREGISTRARWPAKRFQSLARVSGRSMPAELTSRFQAPGIGSSTSNTALR